MFGDRLSRIADGSNPEFEERKVKGDPQFGGYGVRRLRTVSFMRSTVLYR